MKAIVTRVELLDALQTVSQAIVKHVQSPVLACVYIKARQGAVTVIGSSMENSLMAEIGCGGVIEGEVLVPAEKFTAVIRNLQDELVTLTSNEDDHDNKVKVTTDSFAGELFGFSAQEYPHLESTDYIGTFTAPAKLLATAIQRSMFAVSHDDSRKALTGILLDMRENEYRIVSTDGRRLSMTTHTTDCALCPRQLVIPAYACNIIRKLMAGVENIELLYSDNQLTVNVEKTKYRCKLIDSAFPDYTKVLPEQILGEVYCTRQALLKSISVMSVFSSESRTVAFAVTDSAITIESQSSGTGAGKSTVSAKYDGEQITYTLSADYLHEALTACSGDSLVIKTYGQNKPLIFSTLDDAANYFCLLMPLKKR